jgi:NADH dehydrogenase
LIRDKHIIGIINAAALLGSSDYEKNYAVNALGVKHLIDFATKHHIDRFIQISSVVVLKQVKGPYGETKLVGQNFLTQSNLNYTVFISAMVIGPESLGLNRILTNLHKFPMVVPLIGMGRQTQHPIFVLDYAAVIVKTLENPVSSRKVYEIAGDSVVPFRDYVSLILKLQHSRKLLVPVPVTVAKLVGYLAQKLQRVPLFTVEHVIGVLQDSKLDTTLVKKELGFVPTPLQDALVHCLASINKKYGFYLKARREETIRL